MSDDRDNLILTPEEKRALITLLRETLDEARYPLAPLGLDQGDPGEAGTAATPARTEATLAAGAGADARSGSATAMNAYPRGAHDARDQVCSCCNRLDQAGIVVFDVADARSRARRASAAANRRDLYPLGRRSEKVHPDAI